MNPAAHLATLATNLTDAIKGSAVLARSGLIPFPRLDHAIHTAKAIKKFGPFAGIVNAHATSTPHTVALIDEAGPITYGELDSQANALARIWSEAGLSEGSVVAALGRNHRGLVLCMIAAGKLGTRLVLMNTGFAGPQLADVAVRENVVAIAYDSEFSTTVASLPNNISRFCTWNDSDGRGGDTGNVSDVLELAKTVNQGPLPEPKTQGGFVLLTSGTTGTPKGAPREKTSPLASAQFLDRIPLKSGQTMLMAAPIFHGTGLSQFVLAFALGNTVVMHRRFDPETTLSAIAEHQCQSLVVVPTMLQRIIDLEAAILDKYRTTSLKIIFAAGSSLSPDLCTRTMDIFGDVLYNLYGSTEVAVATVATPSELRQAPGTVGRPPVTCHVRLYDDQGKNITRPNTVGRVFVSSGLSFSGYTDGRNKEIIDGMLSSGDVGHFNSDGLLFIDGRDDDMIVSGGENVFPLEVENLLADRHDVLEAAVIGVPDSDFGHRLKAFVVASADSNRDSLELQEYVKAHLARYKAPREIVFIDELPRNATGKLLRSKLSEMTTE
ncbi:MAG: acyl-CoA synthetase [Mycobacteriaceae bacterium]